MAQSLPLTATDKTPPSKAFKDRAFWFAVDAVAIVFWSYAFIKLFVFDVDDYLASHFIPTYEPLLRFKFVFLAGVFGIALITVRSKRLAGAVALILFYPLFLLLIVLPFVILKKRSWILVLAFANSVISLFQGFKTNVITAAALFVALGLVDGTSNKWLLCVAITMLVAALIVLYVRRFIVVFQPTIVFDAYRRFFPRLREVAPKTFLIDAEMKQVPFEALSPVQVQKWTSNLQSAVLYNRACLFLARKLAEYQNSKLNFLAYTISLIVLTIITIATFTAVNVALFKIDHRLFLYVNDPTPFAFFYYCFNNLFRSSANTITAAMPLSQTFFMLEVFFEMLLGALLLSLFFSVSNERYTMELRMVVAALEQEGKSMESFVSDEYSLSTIDEAIQSLARLKAGLISEIYWLSKQME